MASPARASISVFVALMLAAACSPPVASVESSSAPSMTLAPTAAPTLSPAPTPTPAPSESAVVAHVRQALSNLRDLAAANDTSAIVDWATDEMAWANDNGAALFAEPSLSTYGLALSFGLAGQVFGTDQDRSEAVDKLLSEFGPKVGLSVPVATASPSESPSESPSGLTSKVGQRVTFTSNADAGNVMDLTVARVQTWRSTNQFTIPDSGNKFVTADVLFEGVSGSISAAATEFSITDVAGYVYDLAPMYREPSLPYDLALTKGKKVRGWLTFEVPKALVHGWLVYADTQFAFTVK